MSQTSSPDDDLPITVGAPGRGATPDDVAEGTAELERALGVTPEALTPVVGVIIGSRSDWDTLREAAETLERLRIPYEARVISAHRTPERLYAYAREAADRGLRVIIAGAGGAAHLPGMAAAMTELPVLGVPVEGHALRGVDSLLSIVQMPAGVPVGTLAIGRAGAINAALLAAAILALGDAGLRARLVEFRAAQTEGVPESPE